MSTVTLHLPKPRKVALPRLTLPRRRRRVLVSYLAIPHAADLPPGS